MRVMLIVIVSVRAVAWPWMHRSTRFVLYEVKNGFRVPIPVYGVWPLCRQ